MRKFLHHVNRLWCNHSGRVHFFPVEHHLHLAVREAQHQMITDQDLIYHTKIVGCTTHDPTKRCTRIIYIETGLSEQVKLANEIPVLANLVAVTNGTPAGRVVYDELADGLEDREGRRPTAYDDAHPRRPIKPPIEGNITIGVGTLLKDKPGSRGVPGASHPEKVQGMGLDFDKLIDGTAPPLTDEQINTLRNNGITTATKDATKAFPDFADLSPARQGVVMEMMYNMGSTNFAKNVKTIDAIKKGDFDRAAHEMEINNIWRGKVGDRVDILAAIMRGKTPAVYGEPQ